ncbi:MAG: hypothetical protein J7L47_00495 [Candidatus Odinarchaeota archaeon]|nr:hypothetical protein [Candidatus Odinarchaeota archaeon]
MKKLETFCVLAIIALLLVPLAPRVTVPTTHPTTKFKVTQGQIGHKGTITIDGDPSDWIATPPTQVNTGYYNETVEEYVWLDAEGDDTGDGDYTYPTVGYKPGAADIIEFRMTYDADYVYFMVKLKDLAAPTTGKGFDNTTTTAFSISIDTDHIPLSGQEWCAQTNEVKFMDNNRTDIQVNYIGGFFIVQDKEGKTVLGKAEDLAANVDTDVVEIRVPIGTKPGYDYSFPSPLGQTWIVFLMAGCAYKDGGVDGAYNDEWGDYPIADYVEVGETATPTSPGGGLPDSDTANWADPDIFDIAASGTKADQEQILSAYSSGNPIYLGAPNTALVIKFPLPLALVVTTTPETVTTGDVIDITLNITLVTGEPTEGAVVTGRFTEINQTVEFMEIGDGIYTLKELFDTTGLAEGNYSLALTITIPGLTTVDKTVYIYIHGAPSPITFYGEIGVAILIIVAAFAYTFMLKKKEGA